MSYKQLIEGQRYQISAYISEGLSYRAIAKRLRLSHSTVSREVRYNQSISQCYLPEKAHEISLRMACRVVGISDSVYRYKPDAHRDDPVTRSS